MKKILFIVAKKDFRDIEYFLPAEILRNNGYEIFVGSNDEAGQTALGTDGDQVRIDYNIDSLSVGDFDAIIFVGGPGALVHLDNEKSYQIARQAVKQGKLLTAICIAPVILAKAGVLSGKKATVWSSPMDKGAVKILEENGAIYTEAPVVKDVLITANGPDAAEPFGQSLIQALWK